MPRAPIGGRSERSATHRGRAGINDAMPVLAVEAAQGDVVEAAPAPAHAPGASTATAGTEFGAATSTFPLESIEIV